MVNEEKAFLRRRANEAKDKLKGGVMPEYKPYLEEMIWIWEQYNAKLEAEKAAKKAEKELIKQRRKELLKELKKLDKTKRRKKK